MARASSEKFLVRLPRGLRQRLAKRARSNGRSMNAEAVAALKRCLDTDRDIKALDKLAKAKTAELHDEIGKAKL